MTSKVPQGTLLGHPTGLFLLFSTEMWERFCYYGMRALVVLTLVAAVDGANPGFGMDRAQALVLYGWYTSSAYATNILGGIIADNYLGQRRSVIFGGLIMAAAQFTLFFAVPGSLSLYYIGLVLMALGVGLFKPNISTMVGELYSKGDARRDAAFSIFYMGINIGAFFAPLITSTLGEDPNYGWRWGYFSAGVGMLISVAIQLFLAQRYLGDIGRVPNAKVERANAGGVKQPLTRDEVDRLKVVFSMFIFITIFWTAFEQAGGLLNLFAQDHTDRMIGAFEIPAGWFQSANALYIVLFAPVFAWLWVKLGKMNLNPSAPIKVAAGMVLTAIGFGFLILGVFEMQSDVAHKSAVIWLMLGYLFHTLGELCISPVGLSLMTKLAPLRLMSFIMGVWFLMPACAYFFAGYIGAFTEYAGEYAFVVDAAAKFGVAHEHAGLFFVFAAIAAVLVSFAVVMWAVSHKLIVWMHGAEDVVVASVDNKTPNAEAQTA